jgi:hypothetical protein
MAFTLSQSGKSPHPPAGCDGYLTRRQAAQALGFASEFKIRQFEKEGLLQSVRGPMRAAFYPRTDILVLKARLAAKEPGTPPRDWTDAELITLLGHPTQTGEARSAIDLVLETQIGVDRAERIHGFWMAHRHPLPTKRASLPPVAKAPAVATEAEPTTEGERRNSKRISHDKLVRALRDPDPHVREQAFARLKETRSPSQ